MDTTDTLAKMKELVHTVLPDAKVILFGSRANNTAHEESDWDLLILDKSNIDKKTKWAVHDVLYPLSVELFTFINSIVANEDEWENNPGWYALKLSISRNPVIA